MVKEVVNSNTDAQCQSAIDRLLYPSEEPR